MLLNQATSAYRGASAGTQTAIIAYFDLNNISHKCFICQAKTSAQAAENAVFRAVLREFRDCKKMAYSHFGLSAAFGEFVYFMHKRADFLSARI